MLRKITVVILFCCLIPMLWGYDNEPDGFRGIRWGTDISCLEGMEPGPKTKAPDLTKIYYKMGEIPKIGDAQLEDIQYLFYKGKLWLVDIYASGFDNVAALERVVINRFGPADINETNQKWWGGKVTSITFKFDDEKKRACLNFYSQEIGAQVAKDELQKDGF